MLRLITSCAGVVLLIAAFSASAKTQRRQPDPCREATGADSIAACTRDITSGNFKSAALVRRFNNRGLAFDSKGEYDRAVADFNEAIRLDPKNARVFNSRGFAHNQLLAELVTDSALCKEQMYRAIEACSHLIASSPNDAMLLYYRGRAHSAMSDRLAFNDYSEAIGRTADNSSYVSAAGKELRAAIADYSAAIQIDPNLVVALNARGRAYRVGGRHDRALVDYLETVRIDPDNQEARRAVEELQSRTD